jgi:hypothetical protein
MKRSRIALVLAAGVVAAGGAAASAQNLWNDLFTAHGKSGPTAEDQARNAALAKAAWQAVASHKADVLGMIPPLNQPAYAPIYPDGMILLETTDVKRPTAGALQYAAAAPVGAVLEFYRAAAVQARLPVRAANQAPNGDATFVAGDGRRQVTVRLTRQFANSTVVDLSYS